MDARILLVTPNWRWDVDPMPVDTLTPPRCAPLEWAYLCAGLQDAEVRIIDAYAPDLPLQSVRDGTEEFAPTSVIISTTPSLLYWRCPPLSLHAVSEAVAGIRDVTDVPIVLIGPHGTTSPAWALAQTGADACFRGSFENELAPLLKEGPVQDHHSLATRKNAGVIHVESARQLPLASFAVFDFESHYGPHMWCVTQDERAKIGVLSPGALLEASRGCPWNCAYCAKAPVRDRYERRHLERIAGELDQLRGMNVEYVFFIDETFNLPGPHFEGLLQCIYDSGLKFGFQGRPDLISESIARRLRDAGCVYAELGLDVVDDGISEKIGRRQSIDRGIHGVEICMAHLPIVRHNRLNLSTLDYRSILGPDEGQDWVIPPDPAYPYPGSLLGDRTMSLYGYEDFNWEFAQRYSWWLRLEVHLQRNDPDLPVSKVAELKDAFLSLSRSSASSLAARIERIKDLPGFHELNKAVLGRGGKVGVRHPSARRS